MCARAPSAAPVEPTAPSAVPVAEGTIADHRQKFGEEEDRGHGPDEGENHAAEQGCAERQQGEAERRGYA